MTEQQREQQRAQQVIEWLAQLALSSAISLAIGALMLSLLVLLARHLHWLNSWREPWLAAAVLTFASFCLGFLPSMHHPATIELSLPAVVNLPQDSNEAIALAAGQDHKTFFWLGWLVAWGQSGPWGRQSISGVCCSASDGSPDCCARASRYPPTGNSRNTWGYGTRLKG
ncbi:hypothetical protein [Microbulbifer sp. ALW1]|uniref:hypothetical protein n=1 Tax=Microbulbifer sp. (strain ALW1) TaxID=1516059 RepID=UPI001F2A0B80|nr:hypothetical protein [Microbulbifer sp. ALW1]